MNSYLPIFEAWKCKDRDMAADTGATPASVQKWRQRDKIPPGWWRAVASAGRRNKHSHISLDTLAVIAENQRLQRALSE